MAKCDGLMEIVIAEIAINIYTKTYIKKFIDEMI